MDKSNKKVPDKSGSGNLTGDCAGKEQVEEQPHAEPKGATVTKDQQETKGQQSEPEVDRSKPKIDSGGHAADLPSVGKMSRSFFGRLGKSQKETPKAKPPAGSKAKPPAGPKAKPSAGPKAKPPAGPKAPSKSRPPVHVLGAAAAALTSFIPVASHGQEEPEQLTVPHDQRHGDTPVPIPCDTGPENPPHVNQPGMAAGTYPDRDTHLQASESSTTVPASPTASRAYPVSTEAVTRPNTAEDQPRLEEYMTVSSTSNTSSARPLSKMNLEDAGSYTHSAERVDIWGDIDPQVAAPKPEESGDVEEKTKMEDWPQTGSPPTSISSSDSEKADPEWLVEATIPVSYLLPSFKTVHGGVK